jgi:hypothetical protein
MVFLAGPAAEAFAFGEIYGGEGDRHMFAEQYATLTRDRPAESVVQLVHDTVILVEERWSDIERVADALIEHKTLDASQIRDLLATPVPRGWAKGRDIMSVVP